MGCRLLAWPAALGQRRTTPQRSPAHACLNLDCLSRRRASKRPACGDETPASAPARRWSRCDFSGRVVASWTLRIRRAA